MLFLRLLLKFITGLLFNRDEYQVNSKNFNPIRVIIVPLIVIYAITITIRIYEYRRVMEENCPACIAILDKL